MTSYCSLYYPEEPSWPVLYAAYGTTIFGFNVEGRAAPPSRRWASQREFYFDIGTGAPAPDPKRIYKAPVPVGTAYHITNMVQHMALDAHRSMLVVCAAQAIFALEARSGRRLATREEAHSDTISCGALVPKSRLLFTGGEDCALRSWRLHRLHRRGDLEISGQAEVVNAHEGGVLHICHFEQDGLLLTAGGDLHFAFWGVYDNGNVLQQLCRIESGHKIRIDGLKLAMAGGLVLSGDSEGSLRVWRRGGGGPPPADRSCSSSSASAGTPAGTPAGAALQLVAAEAISLGGLNFSCHPREGLFVTSGSEAYNQPETKLRQVITLWSLTDDGQVQMLYTIGKIDNYMHAMVVMGTAKAQRRDRGGRRYLVGVACESSLHAWRVLAAASQQGGGNGAERGADARAEWLISSKDCHDEPVSCLAYDPAKSVLITIDDASTFKTWRVQFTGKVRLLAKKERALPDRVECLATDFASRLLFTGDRNCAIRSWHLADDGEVSLLATAEETHPKYTRCLAFLPRVSPDGSRRLLVSGGGEPNQQSSLRTWGFERSRLGQLVPLDKQMAHANHVSRIVFDDVSFTLLTSGYDRTIHLWKIAETGAITPFANFPESHLGWIQQMFLDKSSRRLITTARDGYMKVWHFDAGGNSPCAANDATAACWATSRPPRLELLSSTATTGPGSVGIDVFGLQVVNCGWKADRSKLVIFFGEEGKLFARKLAPSGGHMVDSWFPRVSDSAVMKAAAFAGDRFEHLWVALASGTVLGLSIFDYRLPRVAAMVGVLAAAGQLLSFGFKVVTPPELEDTATVLRTMEKLHLEALNSPPLIFGVSVGAVLLFVVVVLADEAAAHRFFLSKSVAMYIPELLMMIYCYAITGVGVLPLLQLILHEALCMQRSIFNSGRPGTDDGKRCFSVAHVGLVVLPGSLAIILLLATTMRLLQVDSQVGLVRARGFFGLFSWREDVPLERPPRRIHALSTHSTVYSKMQLLAKIILACVTVITGRIAVNDKPLRALLFSCAAVSGGLLLVCGSCCQPFFEPQRGAMNLPFRVNPNGLQVGIACGILWTYLVQLFVSVVQFTEYHKMNDDGFVWLNRLIFVPMLIGYILWWRRSRWLARRRAGAQSCPEGVELGPRPEQTTNARPLLEASDPTSRHSASARSSAGHLPAELGTGRTCAVCLEDDCPLLVFPDCSEAVCEACLPALLAQWSSSGSRTCIMCGIGVPEDWPRSRQRGTS